MGEKVKHDVETMFIRYSSHSGIYSTMTAGLITY